jgi:AcrR family transcriptional regulator
MVHKRQRRPKKGSSEFRLRGRPPNDPVSTREALLKAAATLFNTDGYFGTDTNKIARAAGFAPATFYRHFNDKKEVFLAAYAHWVAEDWRIIEAALRDQNDPAAIARIFVRRYKSHHRAWGAFRRSMHALVATDDEARAFHVSTRAAQLDRMQALLREIGAPTRPREDLLFRFLSIERSANALTDDDLTALGTSAEALSRRIEQEIRALLTND